MKRYAIGIDFGGTFIKLALLNKEGRILRRARIETRDYATVGILLKAMLSEIEKLLKKARLSPGDLRGVGIGVPGLVDFRRGLVFYLTNVAGWKNVFLKNILESKLKVPVLVDNDVNLMALGELKFGAGKGARSLICVTLGTGVGGGIILDGNLYRGSTSVAGEIGHMPLNEKGLRCNCGGFGCLERYVGNRYIVEDVKRRIRAGASTSIKKLVKGDLSLITPLIISRAAKRGDRFAVDLWQTIGGKIGVNLAGVINLLNPDKIIIGGGLAEAGEILFDSIRNTVNKRALPVSRKAVEIVKAKLGQDAGVIGAAALFL